MFTHPVLEEVALDICMFTAPVHTLPGRTSTDGRESFGIEFKGRSDIKEAMQDLNS